MGDGEVILANSHVTSLGLARFYVKQSAKGIAW